MATVTDPEATLKKGNYIYFRSKKHGGYFRVVIDDYPIKIVDLQDRKDMNLLMVREDEVYDNQFNYVVMRRLIDLTAASDDTTTTGSSSRASAIDEESGLDLSFNETIKNTPPRVVLVDKDGEEEEQGSDQQNQGNTNTNVNTESRTANTSKEEITNTNGNENENENQDEHQKDDNDMDVSSKGGSPSHGTNLEDTSGDQQDTTSRTDLEKPTNVENQQQTEEPTGTQTDVDTRTETKDDDIDIDDPELDKLQLGYDKFIQMKMLERKRLYLIASAVQQVAPEEGAQDDNNNKKKVPMDQKEREIEEQIKALEPTDPTRQKFSEMQTNFALMRQGGVHETKQFLDENPIIIRDENGICRLYRVCTTNKISYDMIEEMIQTRKYQEKEGHIQLWSMQTTLPSGKIRRSKLIAVQFSRLAELKYKQWIGVSTQAEDNELIIVEQQEVNRKKSIERQRVLKQQMKEFEHRKLKLKKKSLKLTQQLKKKSKTVRFEDQLNQDNDNDNDDDILGSEFGGMITAGSSIPGIVSSKPSNIRSRNLNPNDSNKSTTTTPQVHGLSMFTGKTIVSPSGTQTQTAQTGSVQTGQLGLMSSRFVTSMQQNRSSIGLGTTFMSQEQLLKQHQNIQSGGASILTGTGTTSLARTSTPTDARTKQGTKKTGTKRTQTQAGLQQQQQQPLSQTELTAPPKKRQRQGGVGVQQSQIPSQDEVQSLQLFGQQMGLSPISVKSSVSGTSTLQDLYGKLTDTQRADEKRNQDEYQRLRMLNEKARAEEEIKCWNQMLKINEEKVKKGQQPTPTDEIQRIIAQTLDRRLPRPQPPIIPTDHVTQTRDRQDQVTVVTTGQDHPHDDDHDHDDDDDDDRKDDRNKDNNDRGRPGRGNGRPPPGGPTPPGGGGGGGGGDPGRGNGDGRGNRDDDRDRGRDPRLDGISLDGSDAHHPIINKLLSMLDRRDEQLNQLLNRQNRGTQSKQTEYDKQIEKMKAQQDLNYNVKPFSGDNKNKGKSQQEFVRWFYNTIKYVEKCRIQQKYEPFFVKIIGEKGLTGSAKKSYNKQVFQNGEFQRLDDLLIFLFKLYPLEDVVKYYFHAVFNVQLPKQPLEIILTPLTNAIDVYKLIWQYTEEPIQRNYTIDPRKYSKLAIAKLSNRLIERLKNHCKIKNETLPATLELLQAKLNLFALEDRQFNYEIMNPYDTPISKGPVLDIGKQVNATQSHYGGYGNKTKKNGRNGNGKSNGNGKPGKKNGSKNGKGGKNSNKKGDKYNPRKRNDWKNKDKNRNKDSKKRDSFTTRTRKQNRKQSGSKRGQPYHPRKNPDIPNHATVSSKTDFFFFNGICYRCSDPGHRSIHCTNSKFNREVREGCKQRYYSIRNTAMNINTMTNGSINSGYNGYNHSQFSNMNNYQLNQMQQRPVMSQPMIPFQNMQQMQYIQQQPQMMQNNISPNNNNNSNMSVNNNNNSQPLNGLNGNMMNQVNSSGMNQSYSSRRSMINMVQAGSKSTDNVDTNGTNVSVMSKGQGDPLIDHAQRNLQAASCYNPTSRQVFIDNNSVSINNDSYTNSASNNNNNTSNNQ